MSFLLDALRQHFGHDGFRVGQEALVRAVIGGHDVLAVMPTGSGKSLGYQLPAVVLPGTTIVVSPLISLMKDQVDKLDRRGVAAAALHSMLGATERRDAWRRARKGLLRLLYAAPERVRSDAFLALLRQMPVARFVVDEAHCVSEWGHDFRPDYRRLRAAALQCRRADGPGGRPPLAAFTATATAEVRDDIVNLLGLAKPTVIVSGFDRPNIELHVRPVAGDWEKRDLLPRLIGTGRALVYASTRRRAEQAAETLRAVGVVEPEDVARRKELEHQKLQRMVAYATTVACLRTTILRYFGDPAAKEPCGACSNCHRRAVLDTGVLEFVQDRTRSLTAFGQQVMAGRVSDVGRSRPVPRTRTDAALERALRSWRIGLARRQGVPPSVILRDKTLRAIVAARPRTPGELLSVAGVGPATVEKYGPAILALTATGW